MYVVAYAKAQRSFAQTLLDFKFETIGSQQTDEEIVISEYFLSPSLPLVHVSISTCLVYVCPCVDHCAVCISVFRV